MRVALIEDNLALRSSLADFLSVKGHQVHEVGEAIEFYQLLRSQKFDVAVVDINLPDYDGFSITRYLASKQHCAVIITSVRETLEDRVKGYEAGADIYMTKPVDPEELVAAIEMIGRRFNAERKGEETPPPETGQGWRVDNDRRCLCAPNGELAPLTAREVRLLRALAETDRNILNRREVEDIIGEEGQVSRSSLDTLLSRLRAKVRDRTGLELPLATNHNLGFSFLAPIEAI